jgi:hypothetical protein
MLVTLDKGVSTLSSIVTGSLEKARRILNEGYGQLIAEFEFNVLKMYQRTAIRLNIQIPFTDRTI